jgi:hypothetical protein
MTDRAPRTELRKGAMPTPRYFQGETLPGKIESLVAVEGYSVDGEVKTFIFFRNLRLPGDLNTQIGRGRVADVLTQLKREAKCGWSSRSRDNII